MKKRNAKKEKEKGKNNTFLYLSSAFAKDPCARFLAKAELRYREVKITALFGAPECCDPELLWLYFYVVASS